MKTKTVLTALVIAGLATTVWAQMGDDDWGDKRDGRRGFEGRQGHGGRYGEGEGRGRKQRPGMGRRGDRQPPMEMIIGRLLQNPEAREKLGLTEEQANAIKTGSEEIRTQMEDLHKQMRAAAEEQVKLLQADAVDEAAVMAAVEKTGDIRTEIAKLRVQGLIMVKQTLSADQIAKVKEFIKNQMRQRRRGRRDGDGEGGEGRRPGGRGGRGRGWGRDKEDGEGSGIRGGWRKRDRARDDEDDAGEEL